MRIAFYKGKSVSSKLIRWWTRGVYSHVAIEIGGDWGWVEAWYSSNSVRIISTLSIGHTPGTHVDLFDIEVTPEQQDKIETFLRAQVNKPYDSFALLGFILRKKVNKKGSWFCSELVSAGLAHGGIPALRRINHAAVSPNQLVTSPLLRKVGHYETR